MASRKDKVDSINELIDGLISELENLSDDIDELVEFDKYYEATEYVSSDYDIKFYDLLHGVEDYITEKYGYGNIPMRSDDPILDKLIKILYRYRS